VRVNALVSGGLVPPARRGALEASFVGVEDWYATFCGLAGVDPADARAAAAGLPPIDSLDVWPLLSGANATAPRAEVVLGATAGGDQAAGGTVVQGLINATSGLKVLVGGLAWSSWPSAVAPGPGNGPPNVAHNCSPACLFDVFADPSERVDLAGARPAETAAMLARLRELNASVFSPNRGHGDDKAACAAAAAAGGFLVPFLP
jgi:arylsulfatase I/J